VRATLLINTKNCFTPLLQQICFAGNCSTGRIHKAVCPPSPKPVPPVLIPTLWAPDQPPLSPVYLQRCSQAQALCIFPSWAGRTRVWGKGGCQTGSARVVGFFHLLVRLKKINELKGSMWEKTKQPFPGFLYKTSVKKYTCKPILLYFYCTCERKE